MNISVSSFVNLRNLSTYIVFISLMTGCIFSDDYSNIEEETVRSPLQVVNPTLFTHYDYEHAFKSSRNKSQQIDWYQFSAVNQQTFVIELFDVSSNLTLTYGNHGLCNTNAENLSGLALEVYDSNMSLVEKQCKPLGSGNVHNLLAFTTKADGNYYIRVTHNNHDYTDSGEYHIRLLSSYENTASMWNLDTHEPNNSIENAYELQIGLENSVESSIIPKLKMFSTHYADIDWYRFRAHADENYVIEVSNVDSSLSLTWGDMGFCNQSTEDLTGLSLEIFDHAGTKLTSQCQPQGSGNTHNLVEFTAPANEDYFIRVSHNNIAGNDSGAYKISILPHFDHSASTWDDSLHEPNNSRFNAYPLLVGLNNAIESKIVEKNINYSTHFADIDWFKFDALAYREYVVEVFNAESSLSLTTGSFALCNQTDKDLTGLAIEVFNSEGEIINQQCEPQGSSNIHNLLSFSTTEEGAHFVRVSLNNHDYNDHGSYSIRILPRYDQTIATWNDDTHEPNNAMTTAFALTPGANNAITTSIIKKDQENSTYFADIDWYYFEAQPNQNYTVELFDVAGGLSLTSGTNGFCNQTTENYTGLAIEAFNASGIALSRQCKPQGAANVHNLLQITTVANEIIFVRVMLNNHDYDDNGNYSIRVLPQYDTPSANWDESSHEPNNSLFNAYSLQTGADNHIQSSILQKTSDLSTNLADIDWFRFDAKANQRYLIEVSDVSSELTLTTGSGGFCNDSDEELTGLAIEVYDANGNLISQQCKPNGINSVHNSLAVVVTEPKSLFIRLTHNNHDGYDFGLYQLQVTEQ